MSITDVPKGPFMMIMNFIGNDRQVMKLCITNKKFYRWLSAYKFKSQVKLDSINKHQYFENFTNIIATTESLYATARIKKHAKYALPKHTTKLEIVRTYCFNKKQKRQLLNTQQWINFPTWTNQLNYLTHLTIGFGLKIAPKVKLPKTVTHLTFKNHQPHNIDDVIHKQHGLISLKTSLRCNTDLLPKSLKILYLDHLFEHGIRIINFLPDGLETLVLNDTQVLDGVIPNTVKTIVIGKHGTIDLNCIHHRVRVSVLDNVAKKVTATYIN